MTSATAKLGGVLRRRSGVLVIVAALAIMGAGYGAFAAPKSSAQPQASNSIAVREGQKLYMQSCVTCHGANAQGVKGRGPSLIGVGSASVQFQVGTGRMPAVRQEAQQERKKPHFDSSQTNQLGAYIQSLGGGPQIPSGSLRNDKDIATGGDLFRVNCASCHSFGMGGGALSSGKSAPGLEQATDQQIYAAMLTGPESMPVFGDNQLTPDEKRAIISYVQGQKADQDPGGFGIGRTGPVPEGLVAFLVGLGILLLGSLWIAGKS